MKLDTINNKIRGWFIGNFEDASFKTDLCEVSYKKHIAGENWETHYQKKL